MVLSVNYVNFRVFHWRAISITYLEKIPAESGNVGEEIDRSEAGNTSKGTKCYATIPSISGFLASIVASSIELA